MSAAKQKPVLKLKDPKRFLIQKEHQILQRQIFDTFIEWTTERLIDEMYISLMSVKLQFCMMDGLTKELRAQDSGE